MKPLAILLVAAGVVSAASVPIEARQNALTARQDASNEEADIDTAVEGEVDVEEDAAVEVDVEEEEDAVAEEEAEEIVEEEVEDENVSSGDGVSSGGGTSSSPTNSSSSNFSNFNLDDFLRLSVNDVLGISNLRQHEVDLAAALLGMLNLFGLNNVFTANDLIGFGFQVELQMFLALQQVGQLLSIGRIGFNDAFVLVQNNILGNGINNFGRNGFNGLNGFNGFNFGGFGNGRAFSRGGFSSGSGGRVVGK